MISEYNSHFVVINNRVPLFSIFPTPPPLTSFMNGLLSIFIMIELIVLKQSEQSMKNN